jgi:hypothetical protein
LCGSAFVRRKRWRYKKIKERKRGNTREAGSGRKARNRRREAERKEVVGKGEDEMRKVRKKGGLPLRESRMRRDVGCRRRSRWSGRSWGERRRKRMKTKLTENGYPIVSSQCL